MKKTLLILSLIIVPWSQICFAQATRTMTVEDFRPATSNQPGKQYPQVNSEGRVRASIQAPQAQRVQLDIGGVKYDLTKDEKGIWTGNSAPRMKVFTITS